MARRERRTSAASAFSPPKNIRIVRSISPLSDSSGSLEGDVPTAIFTSSLEKNVPRKESHKRPSPKYVAPKSLHGAREIVLDGTERFKAAIPKTPKVPDQKHSSPRQPKRSTRAPRPYVPPAPPALEQEELIERPTVKPSPKATKVSSPEVTQLRLPERKHRHAYVPPAPGSSSKDRSPGKDGSPRMPRRKDRDHEPRFSASFSSELSSTSPRLPRRSPSYDEEEDEFLESSSVFTSKFSTSMHESCTSLASHTSSRNPPSRTSRQGNRLLLKRLASAASEFSSSAVDDNVSTNCSSPRLPRRRKSNDFTLPTRSLSEESLSKH